MFCRNCGKEIPNNERVCPFCGEGKKMPAWIKLLLLAGLVFILSVTIFLFAGEAALDVVESQIQSLRQNQMTEAYYKYTSPKFQEATSLEAFKEFMKPLMPFITQGTNSASETRLENNIKLVKETFTMLDQQKIAIEYQLLKKEDEWKIENMKLVTAEGEERTHIQNEPVTPIIEQLKTIKDKKIEEAYNNFSSSTFKSVTSLEAFKGFLKRFPVFENYTSYDILNLKKMDEIATVLVLLHEGPLSTQIAYTLDVENHLWKIQGIEIVPEGAEAKKSASFNSDELIQIIQGQLEAIKKGDYKAAYNNFTTKSFRTATSYEEFEKFLKANPVFTQNQSSNFTKLTFNDNVAVFSGKLRSKTGEERQVEVFLALENGKWKILEIHIFEKNAPEQSQSSSVGG